MKSEQEVLDDFLEESDSIVVVTLSIASDICCRVVIFSITSFLLIGSVTTTVVNVDAAVVKIIGVKDPKVKMSDSPDLRYCQAWVQTMSRSCSGHVQVMYRSSQYHLHLKSQGLDLELTL